MHDRDQPRTVKPGHPKYLKVNTSTGSVWFRLPRPSKAVRLLAPMQAQASTLLRVQTRAQEARDLTEAAVRSPEQAAEALDLARDLMGDDVVLAVETSEGAIGSAIGECWHHPTRDFDATLPPNATTAQRMAWGDAVLEELDEEYPDDADDIIKAFTRALSTRRMPSDLEVSDRVKSFRDPVGTA